MKESHKGKDRRAHELLTEAQKLKMGELIRDGYSIEAMMDRYGLTDEEQVKTLCRKPGKISKLDRVASGFSFRTTYAEVARDHVWKGERTKWRVDNSW